MDLPIMDKIPGKPRLLVAPLDWGLGHASRCIPIIHELMAQGCEVWLAGEGYQENLLKEEFPQLTFLNIKGYRVNYAKSAMGLLMNMLRQTKKILHAIKNENEWLKKIVAEFDIDAVISDNRYGMYHDSVPCIFITHQLTIKSPLGK
ncbi:MAG: glycosyltransferase, partial [Chitinophagaceae bacterium]